MIIHAVVDTNILVSGMMTSNETAPTRQILSPFQQVSPTLHSAEVLATAQPYNQLNINLLQNNNVADTASAGSVGNSFDAMYY